MANRQKTKRLAPEDRQGADQNCPENLYSLHVFVEIVPVYNQLDLWICTKMRSMETVLKQFPINGTFQLLIFI